MDLFQEQFMRYELRRIGQSDEFEIVIYLADQLSEFANDLGTLSTERKNVVTIAKQIVNEHFPTIKVTMVKVIIGGMIVTTFPLINGDDSTAQASTTANTVQVSQAGSIYYLTASGDTLWVISKRYNTTVDHIKRANQLTSDILLINQRLIIPKTFHTVGTGDYLAVLASKYGITVDAIKEANGLSSDMIYPGQVLIIPTAISVAAQPAPVPAPATQPEPLQPSSQKNTYSVVPGDSLFMIANRFGTTVEALRNANSLTSDMLRIGQVLTIPTTAASAPVQEKDTPPVTEQTNRMYTVVAGDSLFVIANRFGTTVGALRTTNHLTSDMLRIGQTLTIPNGAPSSEIPKEEESVTPPPVKPAPETPVSSVTYIVAPGDSLWAIAQRFGLTVAVLKNENNLTSDVLRIGQTLRIPKGGFENALPTPVPTPAPTPAPTPVPENVAAETRSTFSYSVRSGDSLFVIAKSFEVTVDAIRSANRLTSDSLRVGQVLTIPNGIQKNVQTGENSITYITHTIASGDNIWDLSIRYGIPQSELLQANQLTTSSSLTVGQQLRIPVHHIVVKSVVSDKHGEFLDWWKEAQYVFTIGKTAKVTDFATGKSFFIKRTIGANHADCETISINDTNIAQSIWGGFSWTTRAIILEVDGRKLAASMSFMPHEREYIANNGITGHFDVYFGNSTRHVDGKPDSSHQAQVEKAAGLK